MQMLVDDYSSEIPDDVLLLTHILGKPVLDKGLLRKKDLVSDKHDTKLDAIPLPLDRWYTDTRKYKDEAAGKVGFLSSLFSGSTKSVAAGVVHEAKRYRLEKTDEGREVEIGVSVRLSVATTNMNADFDLSIPNLAAQAQLGMAEARIGILVIGFHGPIGDLLPAPDDLNVENFSLFMNATKKIQDRVFGPDGVNYFSPTILSYED